ncbi:hypothetical protein HG530_007846 [Fusarium avenaceum]|nr:hypothetical protein HG530_007846 [Fusarium avenaceum]
MDLAGAQVEEIFKTCSYILSIEAGILHSRSHFASSLVPDIVQDTSNRINRRDDALRNLTGPLSCSTQNVAEYVLSILLDLGDNGRLDITQCRNRNGDYEVVDSEGCAFEIENSPYCCDDT